MGKQERVFYAGTLISHAGANVRPEVGRSRSGLGDAQAPYEVWAGCWAAAPESALVPDSYRDCRELKTAGAVEGLRMGVSLRQSALFRSAAALG